MYSICLFLALSLTEGECTLPESCWVLAAEEPCGLQVVGADMEKIESRRPAGRTEMRRLLGRTWSGSCNKSPGLRKAGEFAVRKDFTLLH